MSREFPPEYRLRSKSDFNGLRAGRRIHVDGLRFVYRKSSLQHARLGLAVSRKYGNAVKRNRLKRKLRETFRQHPIRSHPFDLLVYPSMDASQTFDVSAQMERALNRIIYSEPSEKS